MVKVYRCPEPQWVKTGNEQHARHCIDCALMSYMYNCMGDPMYGECEKCGVDIDYIEMAVYQGDVYVHVRETCFACHFLEE